MWKRKNVNLTWKLVNKLLTLLIGCLSQYFQSRLKFTIKNAILDPSQNKSTLFKGHLVDMFLKVVRSFMYLVISFYNAGRHFSLLFFQSSVSNETRIKIERKFCCKHWPVKSKLELVTIKVTFISPEISWCIESSFRVRVFWLENSLDKFDRDTLRHMG